MREGLYQADPQQSRTLAAHGAMMALWLTAAIALVGYALSDRPASYQILCVAALAGAGLVLPLVLVQLTAQRVQRVVPPAGLVCALCILFGAALSLDLLATIRNSLGIVRGLLLAVCVALAAWHLWRGRFTRLSLSAAMGMMCLAWILCGVLRATDAPLMRRLAVLFPLLTGVAVLLPGLPRLDALLSRPRKYLTLAACAALAMTMLRQPVPEPAVLAAPTAPAPAGGRSAIVVVLDTLRRDHMSLYGYTRKTTPALDQKAGAGLVFDDATSVSAWTLPSHASMFTGLWPRTHGAHAHPAAKDTPVNITPLAPEHQTLAEIAHEHGYLTVGLTSNHFYMNTRWGMSQGFAEYLCRRPQLMPLALRNGSKLARFLDPRRVVYADKPYFTAPEMTRAAIAWLERHQQTPFLMFLNYMDAHLPNASPGSQGLPFEDEAFHFSLNMGWRSSQSPSEKRSYLNEYDREVIHMDHWVGVFLDYLERSGLSDRTLVILTADHGEFLGEHGYYGHTRDIYGETVNVPMVVWGPGTTPGRVSRPVQGPDVFPTILRYLQLPIPPGTQGQPLLEADHPIVSEEYYHPLAKDPRFARVVRTIRTSEHRYFNISTGGERLFRFPGDPFEANDLISEEPGAAALARARLDEWLSRIPETQARPTAPKLDAEDLDDLRALGYIQ